MKIAPVIALLGISGVGKSSMAHHIVGASPNILHLTAGGLLRNSLNKTSEYLRTSVRDSVLNNQKVLVEALRQARSGRWQIPVLLEAHSIIDNDCEVIEVPTDIMRALNIAGLLLLDEPAHEILTRRGLDARERPKRDLAEITNQQRRSRSVAQKYAIELSIPMIVIKSVDIDIAIDFIKNLVSTGAANTD